MDDFIIREPKENIDTPVYKLHVKAIKDGFTFYPLQYGYPDKTH